ncbi:MAG: hypothetical protein ACRD0G_01135 [Acidimicrobiales bacterium]
MRGWLRQSPETIGVGLVVIGFVVIFLGWNGAAGLDFVEGQLPYLISGGLTGLGLIGAGLVVVLVQAQRRESRAVAARLDDIAEQLRALGGTGLGGPTAVPPDAMVLAGRAAYHDPSCRLVEGRSDFQPMSVETAKQRGLQPCRVCNPDQAQESA